ncbi:hypothetical protein [Agrobacterium tumefaciens]|uniref:hypothetical protein n=1 Tax=Agrobacterium tumefaciens TaxID=358 RepID=UPI00157487B0|nr:hypothetical protein [Agrobacterium tumefaciens]NSX94404.1 hypothetical protein [Agrobacterium tumefaciens]
MQEQNAKKWFDFGPGVSLSLRQSGGRYLVRLELANKPAPAIVEKAFAARWAVVQSGQDGAPAIYEHMNDVRGLSDVATRLEAFFDKARITGAITETARTPTEIAPPVRSAPEVAADVLSVFSKDAPEQLLKHISSTIAHAYSLAGARSTAARQLPFEGDAIGVFDRLVQRTDPIHAAELWGSVVVAVSHGLRGWQDKLDAIMEADASSQVPEIVVDRMVHDLVSTFRKEIETINATGLAAIDLATSIRGRLIEATGDKVGYRIYDGAHFQPKGAPDLGANTFSAQQGVSLDLATDAKARLTLALSAASKGFGIGRDRLFGEETVKFFFAPDMGRAGRDDRGSASFYQSGEDVKLFAIHIVPSRPGALLHEIGHQVHNAGDRDAILRAVGDHSFAQSTRRIVSELEAKHAMPPQHADYLTQPAEIFARAFEAHVTAVLSPAQTGGSLSSVGSPSLTPTGEELAAFISDMKTVVLENRSVANLSEKDDQRRSQQQTSLPAMGM